MKYFNKNFGEVGASATFYLQEANKEIDINRKSPVMIIVPGGAYMWTSWREEEPIALEFISKGFSCVVAKYATEGLEFYHDKTNDFSKEPVSSFPNPLMDLARIISYTRSKAKEWNLDSDSINVLGFSAGGNLTAQIGAYWKKDWLQKLVNLDPEAYKLNSIAIAYGASQTYISDTNSELNKLVNYASLGHDQSIERQKLINITDSDTSDCPPTFIWHTMQDPLVPVENALKLASNLRKHDVDFELHIFEKGKHGLALGDFRTDSKKDRSQSNIQARKWVDLYLTWLTEHKLIHLF
ncbi:alpha/beta hydrolase [Lactobacillus mulieris]|uniref:Alpha/beta hydrolase n=1 Tax=Lactobacillus mulieris TaxID=2508708 RepID=A0AAW5WXV5_9LACO|nr:alpha/beta hydrolase [Lactobacillus mulieris]MCZ3621685.1 alpha/beta hydrolase [Lactobacillus mulieris]MCZ3623039.1 alpha/beta hydrolase [Lactobacillus mulieris]MCZ3635692.1 alpha/beta hydrolase [Lactobacillus mulieris]MCZ3690091.1 alpha/beta hydrolase [Lactobacillus mulieris]MCZ3696029.1 alpha/beta hydrolase [Lactobacillus mulieris]